MDELRREEVAACDTPLNARIHSIGLPPDTVLACEAEAQAVYVKYSDTFKKFEDAEYFSMLPLDKASRDTVLKRAVELEKERLKNERECLQQCASTK